MANNDDFGPWPTPEEQRADHEAAERRRLTHALERHTRALARQAIRPNIEAPAAAEPAAQPRPLGPGRPRWARADFLQRYREAEIATVRPVTPARVAANFRRLDDTTGIEPDSLARLVRRFRE